MTSIFALPLCNAKNQKSGAVKNIFLSSTRNKKFKQKKMCLLMTEVNELFSVCFIRIRLKQG